MEKNHAIRKIVQSYSRQYDILIRLTNLESLPHCSADVSPDQVEELDTTSTTTAPDICRRMQNGRPDDVSNMADFSQVWGVSIQIICHGLIQKTQHNQPPEGLLPENHQILKSLHVELLTQPEIPVLFVQRKWKYMASAVRNAWRVSTLGTTGVAMIEFGSWPQWKTSLVRSGALFKPGFLDSSKSETTDVRIECGASLTFSL